VETHSGDRAYRINAYPDCDPDCYYSTQLTISADEVDRTGTYRFSAWVYAPSGHDAPLVSGATSTQQIDWRVRAQHDWGQGVEGATWTLMNSSAGHTVEPATPRRYGESREACRQ